MNIIKLILAVLFLSIFIIGCTPTNITHNKLITNPSHSNSIEHIINCANDNDDYENYKNCVGELNGIIQD